MILQILYQIPIQKLAPYPTRSRSNTVSRFPHEGDEITIFTSKDRTDPGSWQKASVISTSRSGAHTEVRLSDGTSSQVDLSRNTGLVWKFQ